jgi:anthranilate synthase
VSRYRTAGGIVVERTARPVAEDAIEPIVDALDSRRGAVFTSGIDYPGRYSRWEIGYHSPLLEVVGRPEVVEIEALNARGAVLLEATAAHLVAAGHLVSRDGDRLTVTPAAQLVSDREEDRGTRVGSFRVLRSLLALLHAPEEEHLALAGAFGYDLMFRYEDIALRHERRPDQPDFVLHLPDRLVVADRVAGQVTAYDYEFTAGGATTADIAWESGDAVVCATAEVPERQPAGTYAKVVEVAHEFFARGDLYEVVPGQPFWAPCPSPAAFFRRLRESNPAPYGFLINLGDEQLVGASPEMFVRVEGRRVETCPIAGTIRRGRSDVEDAAQVLALLSSDKDHAELTMCTDVDRNDKARVCVPGSVEVIGRRQIEMYSRLIHTVDHVVGTLREGYDQLDALLTHMWAVTVTGAPKKAAVQFIEDHEEAPRGWYGGAVGMLGVDGNVNTGLTLRTAQVRDRVALVRAGATLLFDSDPGAEEAETELKASALLLAAASNSTAAVPADDLVATRQVGAGVSVLVVDHEDSFTLNLADYFRQTGAEVTTVRWGISPQRYDELAPDLLVLSPGPGRPADFAIGDLLDLATGRGTPTFGVCLGLQGIVEWCGGALRQHEIPFHGRASSVGVEGGTLFAADGALAVGRYHSLFCAAADAPAALRVTARTGDGVAMAVEHRSLPVWGVQFHPESILTADAGGGLDLVVRVVEAAKRARA